MLEDEPTIRLMKWVGSWPDDDPDANLKRDVALYCLVDPLRAIRGLADESGIPVGALCRYVLARYGSAGAGGLLELGPSMIRRLWEPIEEAEVSDTDEARLAAYEQLSAMLSWLMAVADGLG